MHIILGCWNWFEFQWNLVFSIFWIILLCTKYRPNGLIEIKSRKQNVSIKKSERNERYNHVDLSRIRNHFDVFQSRMVGYSYEALSLSPRASACFFALSRKSAMLEFLLWAAAKAAKFNGYCGIENSALFPFIAAAYWK